MTARACAGRAVLAPTRGRRPEHVRAMVQRFDARIRSRIAALVSSHAYFEDLMWSFPAVLQALAVSDPGSAATRAGVQLVRAGAPLRAVAAIVSVPLWTRALPPEAFGPERVRVPVTPEFARDIVNHMPKSPDVAQRWLAFVTFAAKADGDAFALWTAREFERIGPGAETEDVGPLVLFAWFSARRETQAGAVIDKPWNAKQSLAEAVDNAQRWMDRLDMPLYRAPHIIAAAPLAFVDGFEFIQLTTARDVQAEAEAMCNCLGDYAYALSTGRTQVWSMRRNGQRAAALEIVLRDEGGGIPELVQIRAKYNGGVAQDVLHAAYRWLLSWPLVADPFEFRNPAADDDVYRALMKPYWKAKGLVRWLPLTSNGTPFDELRRALWRCTDMRTRRRQRRTRGVPRR